MVGAVDLVHAWRQRNRPLQATHKRETVRTPEAVAASSKLTMLYIKHGRDENGERQSSTLEHTQSKLDESWWVADSEQGDIP